MAFILFNNSNYTNFPATLFIGGVIRKGHHCTVGSFSNEMIKNLHVDKSFVVTNAVDESLDLSTADIEQAELKKLLVSSGNHKYLLTDSAKFGDFSLVSFANVKDFELIISDTNLSKEYIDLLDKKDIKIKLV